MDRNSNGNNSNHCHVQWRKKKSKHTHILCVINTRLVIWVAIGHGWVFRSQFSIIHFVYALMVSRFVAAHLTQFRIYFCCFFLCVSFTDAWNCSNWVLETNRYKSMQFCTIKIYTNVTSMVDHRVRECVYWRCGITWTETKQLGAEYLVDFITKKNRNQSREHSHKTLLNSSV